MINTDILKARVRKGVKFLDKDCPKWYKKVSVRTLDLRTGGCCVLGQVYGGYPKGLESLNGEGLNCGIAYGFWLDPMRYKSKYETWEKGMEQLEKLWKTVIERRKKKKEVK
jgi:hypothetical protein